MNENTIFLGALGSGSSGNAFVIEYQQQAIIIDQGFSCRELLKRFKLSGFSSDKLCGALLTHEHSDHSKGSRVFCDTLELPLYTTAQTARYMANRKALPKQVCAFEPGEKFSLGAFTIQSFSLPHDAVDPVGFRVDCGDLRIGFATDLGYAAEHIKRELKECDALVLESNYDKEMLMNSDRTLELKRRISGVRGHLGNLDCCALLPSLLSERTKLLMMAHISRECNQHEIVRESCGSVLKILDTAGRLHFELLEQDRPSPRFQMDRSKVVCGCE